MSPTPTEGISKGERDELRRIVRGDFRALSSEIDVRRAELMAEIEKRVAERFRASEELIAGADLEVTAIVSEANARIAAAYDRAVTSSDGYDVRWVPLTPPRFVWAATRRDEMRRAMIADLDARVAHAKARMQRQEVDLLKRLSVGALGSTEAHAFLGDIPTVAELVPASRLAELEAGLGDIDDPGATP